MGINTGTAATTPASFQDKLSQQFLKVPDSEFLLARWAYSALVEAQMKGEDGFDLAKRELESGRVMDAARAPGNMGEAMGGGMGGPLLLSLGMNFPGLIQMVKEAKDKGETIKIPRPRLVDGATTESSRKLGPNTRIFGSTQTVGFDEVALTLFEYGGPGDAAGNVVPLGIGEFTQNRSDVDLLENYGYQLRRDRWKFVDDLLYSRLIAAAPANSTGVTRGGAVATDAAFTGIANEPLDYATIIAGTEAIRGRYVPGVTGVGGGKYILVADHHALSQLKLDPMYQRLSVFQPEMNPLFPGYVKTIEDVIVCASNRMPRLTNLGAATNIAGYQSFIVSAGALGWGCGKDAKAIRDKNDDGGRISAYAWNSIEGFQVLDDRFVQLLKTT